MDGVVSLPNDLETAKAEKLHLLKYLVLAPI